MIAMVAVVMMVGTASATVHVLSEPATNFTTGTYKAGAMISVVTFGINQTAGETLDNVTVTVVDESNPDSPVPADFANLTVYKDAVSGTLVGTATTVNVSSATTINTGTTAIGTAETTFYVVVTLNTTPGDGHQFSVDMAADGVVTTDPTQTVATLYGAAIATIDTTAPTLTISTAPTSPSKTKTGIVYTFKFSEDVTGFAEGDITLNFAGAGAGAVDGSSFVAINASTYTLNLDAQDETDLAALTTGQTVVASVDMTALTDLAGNAGVGATTNTWTYDVTAPTMSSAARVDNTHITVTMSESVTSLGISDSGFIVAKNGDPETTYAVSAIAAGSSANLVVLTVADISGSIATGVNVTYNATATNGTITDLAGNDLATATGVIVAAWQTSSGGSGGDGTYPPGWHETPTATVTATKAPTPSATATATDAPPGDKVTPAPTKKPEAAKTTTPAAEGTTAETPKSTPGFTAVFMIAGILAVAYAMMRRRE